MSARKNNFLSEYRIQKFQKFFEILDVNGDGFLSADDYERVAITLAQLTNANAEQAADIRQDLLHYWYIASGDKGKNAKILISEVVEAIIKYQTNTDPDELTSSIATTQSKMFDIIDRCANGNISLEELRIYYNSHNVTDEDFIRDSFQRIDSDADGFITREEFIRALCAYWLSDDPENGFDFIYNPLSGK